MSSAAARQRRHRERAHNGRCVLLVEVDELDLAEALVVAGFLERQNSDDRAAITAALAHVIGLWASSVTRDSTAF